MQAIKLTQQPIYNRASISVCLLSGGAGGNTLYWSEISSKLEADELCNEFFFLAMSDARKKYQKLWIARKRKLGKF